MFAQLARWLKPSPLSEPSHRVYIALVTQSRQPFFYSHLGVPDSLDGRFDMILLHLFLMTERLKADGTESSVQLLQHINDAFIADMDRSLREMGVGDTGVAKRVKQMADALNGRLTVYHDSLGDPEKLTAALTRNLYGTTQPTADHVAQIINYITLSGVMLKSQPIETLINGEIVWPKLGSNHAA